MATVELKQGQQAQVRLKPMALAPAAAFTFVNQTGADLKVTVEGRTVRLHT